MLINKVNNISSELFFEEANRLSAPSPGKTIINNVSYWAPKLNIILQDLSETAITSELHSSLHSIYNKYFSLNENFINTDSSSLTKSPKLLSTALLAIWLIGVSTKSISKNDSVTDALEWFFGTGVIKSSEIKILRRWDSLINYSELRNLDFDDSFLDLFPYILEVFETDNELFYKKNVSRVRKRKLGIYYTPSDVANYMVENIVFKNQRSIGEGKWIDPACGTGIFLRAILEFYIKQGEISRSFFDLIKFSCAGLYGMDISQQAIQSCILTILGFCIYVGNYSKGTFFSYWQQLAKNFAVIDATKFAESSQRTLEKRYNINKIFPKIDGGFDFFVCNPPYSKKRPAVSDKEKGAGKKESHIYLDFIRLMWSLCKYDKSAAAIVVPLSIAYNKNQDFVELRNEISNISGHWHFAHFDRTPDSLFGDDVKTRNTIMFLEKQPYNSYEFFTTPLMRWNSRTRTSFLKKMNYTKLKNISLSDRIPKLGSPFERDVYLKLREKRGNANKWPYIGIPVADTRKMLFVGPTAYNWLPIYRENPYNIYTQKGKHSNLAVITFETEKIANITYGILSSQIMYWLWRVEGDGFHFNKKFIYDMPFVLEDFSDNEQEIIEQQAISLWERISKKPIISENSGIKSISFCPNYHADSIYEIDKILLKVIGINEAQIVYFKKFIWNNAIAGRKKELKSNIALKNWSTGKVLSNV